MAIDSKREKSANSPLPQPLPSRWWLSIKNYFLFREPPLCLRRRGVVFFLFKKVFWKKYALVARVIPFKASFKNSRNSSMIITSFPVTERASDNHPPLQSWLPSHSIRFYSKSKEDYMLMLSKVLSTLIEVDIRRRREENRPWKKTLFPISRRINDG